MRILENRRVVLKMSGCLMVIVVASLVYVRTSAEGAGPRPRTHGTVSREYAEARTIFQKVWQPGEASHAGGDGLGPLYNEQSCVGCHHLGGVGGAGGNDRNVTLLTAFAGPPRTEAGDGLFQGELEDLHPGFRNHTSIVLHHHATSVAEEKRLQRIRRYNTVQTRDDLIALAQSTRSTPALFGAGLIDRVSDGTLLEAEKRKFTAFPEIKGRVSHLRDGRIGRFGWKGQTAGLRDFVLAACSNELGLEVPGHHQASLLSAKDFDPSKMKEDLNNDEVCLLVRFVANLPRPVGPAADSILTGRGRSVFVAVGCATCHAPRLGSIDGLFSDLLLHDLGDRFRDSAAGYGMSTTPGQVVDHAKSKDAKDSPRPTGDAGPTEWRTPPLWGVADSSPYLHNGRAATLDEAIRLHGGEAAETSKRYAKLAFDDHQALLAFLHALTAPVQPRRLSDFAVKRSR